MAISGLTIAALAGGVGGAKLADGLAQVLQPEKLTVIVNTADDFIHLGLRISPDLDTVCYTLAGVANPITGWGRMNETWNAYDQLKRLGLPDWFQLGDADLATHIARTARQNEGWSLTQVTGEFCRRMGIGVHVLPMSDDVVQTRVYSDVGELGFQEYFVQRKCVPVVKEIKFLGAELSSPAPGVLQAIEKADAIIFCPSNPWVSIDPILAVPGIRQALKGHLVLAVSPLIGDKALKGPAAKMFSELGIQPSAIAIAEHYGGLLNCIVIDNSDAHMRSRIHGLGIGTYVSDILMRDRVDRGRLANEIVELITGWEKVIQ
jgi:LPPG:FO 2-phospho-L-lactate transferase